MNKQIKNLIDLFVEQGKELYDTSLQEIQELPEVINHVSNPELKKIIKSQLREAKVRKWFLHKAFKKIGEDIKGESNEYSKSIFMKTVDLINRSQDSEVKDAAIITSIQRLNHDNIASLGALKSYAKEIGQDGISDVFRKILNEEKHVDRELTKIAERVINMNAIN